MKYTDKIDNAIISYKYLNNEICKNIFEENLPFLKASIKFLEDELQNSNFAKKIIASLFCCNFIQNYFYHLIKYIYDNKDVSIDKLYDYSPIIKIIDGEESQQTTHFRFSIKILFMRLLYYNFGPRKSETYENFIKFDFEGRKITFRNQFKDDKKFEDSIPKLINYSKIFLEDYGMDETFKYIYGKVDNDIEKKYNKIFYNLSYYSISFISDSSYRAKFISEDEKMKIYKNVEKILEDNEEIFNYHYTELSYNYLSIMSEKLSTILEKEKSKLGDFKDSNTNYNERILGILINAFRICFISLIKKEKEKYFYGYILSLKDNELLNFLKECFVPGFNSILKNESFNENDFDQNMNSNSKVLFLLLKFIFYSSLFYSYSQGKISESDINNFTINKNQSCLQTLVSIWNALEIELNNIKITKIETFLNLISKYLTEYLEMFLVENCKDENKKNEFQNKSSELIEKCITNFTEYQAYFIDYSMKNIIQEYNYPLRYKDQIYPYMKYFVVFGKPNIIDIKNKITKENHLLNSIYNNPNYDFKCLENFKNYNLIVNNLIKILSYSSYYDKFSSKKINEIDWLKEKIPLIFELIEKNQNDKNIQEIKNATIGNLNDLIKQHYNKFIECQNNNLLMSIRYDYCFKRTFRKINIQDCYNDEHINFNLSSFSNYTFFHSIYSNFISRKSFDKNKKVNYVDYQTFEIDIKNLEEKLFCLLFYRKNIFNKTINTITFRYDGLNKNENYTFIIRNFLKKYPKYEKLDNDLKEKFNSVLSNELKNMKSNIEGIQNDKIFISSDFDKLFDKRKLSDLLSKKLNLSIEQLMKTYKDNNVLSEKIIKIILDMAFSIQELFKYLITFNLSEDIPLFFIYKNLPDNIFSTKHLKSIFTEFKDLCIKHLYSLYEYIELILFPFFLNQINPCYMENISTFTTDHLKMLFDANEFKESISIEITQLIEAIRKFICRYLVSSEKSEVIKRNENLILLLINHELWNCSSPEDEYFSKIRDSLTNINNLLVEPILVMNTLSLFGVLL